MEHQKLPSNFHKISLPSRPSRSLEMKNIAPLKLISNHFELSFPKKEGMMICIYSIDIKPICDYFLFKVKKSLLEYAMKKAKEDISAFSFTHSYFLAFNAKTEQLLYKINIENVTYSITIKKIYETRWEKIELNPVQEQTIRIITQGINHWIEQILKKLKANEYANTQKFFYNDPSHIMKLVDSYFQVCKGMKISFDFLQGGPRVLVDFCTRVLRTNNVLTYMKRFGVDQTGIKEDLIEKVILADYGSSDNYKIIDVEFKLSPKSLFDCNGKSITYAQYFKNNYQINIIDMNQPLLLVIPLKKRMLDQAIYKIYLVPELCKVIGLTDEDRKSYQIMKEMFIYERLEPHQRIDEIAQHVNAINQELKNSGYYVRIENNFKTIDAHKIKVPELTLGKGEIIKPDEKGSFILRSKIVESLVLDYWLLLYSGKGARDDEEVETFCNNLAKAGLTFGIKVFDPLYVNVGSIQGKDYAEAVKKSIDCKVQLVVAFIPKAAKQRVYKDFKKACMQSYNSIPSQVVLTSTLFRNTATICSKIILQIAAKMGNSLWSMVYPKGLSTNIMVIGVDFFQDTIKNKKSVIGFCASSDPAFTKFYSRTNFQAKVIYDISEIIGTMVLDAIKNYFKINKLLPDLIILYRNNVRKKQFFEIIKFEISQIKNAFKSFDEKYNPPFIEVVVTQRVNDRFFLPSSVPTDEKIKYCYPPSGTVIMEEVNSKNYDFYLYGLGKICVPTHYEVLCNDSYLTEDMLAKLTYYQCFGYYNWTGAIRIPACLKYAEKLAQLVGTSLEADPDEKLWSKLHFL